MRRVRPSARHAQTREALHRAADEAVPCVRAEGQEVPMSDEKIEEQLPADEAIAVLNRIHAADPSVLPALIAHRVPCNETVADDPTVQVGKQGDGWEVGLLGIVNGFFGVDERTWGFIAAVYDDDGVLTHFRRTGQDDGK